ncbi:Selenocysteine-specific elongation factor [Echinococcus granulosus]|uniref:Selenocysteine-specific elongation factor n=2 Tax=Echinococcus granulosus TaxID=6210 RepID=W6UAF5_ECHGR|nr:Selenocysteine-specific elongation factor [Echinococcus granulosus]EUB57506.1 Selenocysteine-specific elongation factor [Echinococcus granulosus]
MFAKWMLLNVNVGVLGHVDSGKTTLSKALSTVASTAAFDKNPQSQKRGITLDLGFSSFKVEKNIPPHLEPSDAIQITLVDCPGHASLIRTIICGTHIIDLMLLVVDVNKGFQTQTAECLVIGELTCDALVVVLNKVDLIPPEERDAKIAKMKLRVSKTLQSTKFKDAPIVAVSAIQKVEVPTGEGMDELISTLLTSIPDPREKRSELANLPFLFAVDHCFSKSGQGTVLTGTVLRGCIRVGETVEIPQEKLKKKIKSIQMFRNPIEEISPGDRAGICVTQLDPSVMERGYLAAPDSLSACQACLLTGVARIAYFKGDVCSKQRFHVSIGQDTVLARITCLRRVEETKAEEEFEYVEELHDKDGVGEAREMVLEFDAPVVAPMAGVVIGSRLDTDPLSSSCRLAFYGTVARVFASSQECRTSLSVYRHKQRRGEVERVVDPRHCIVRDLFKAETNWELFTGLAVTVTFLPSSTLATTEGDNADSIPGVVEGSFGRSGKCRIRLSADLPDALVKRFSGKAGKKLSKEATTAENANADAITAANKLSGHLVVTLNFKKHVFDATKRFVQ